MILRKLRGAGEYYLPLLHDSALGKISLVVLLCTLVAASCGEKDDTLLPNESTGIESAESLSPEAESVAIDNFAHTITLEYAKGTDVSNVQIKLTLGEGVTMIEPVESTAFYNLTANPVVKIKSGGQTITYHFVISFLTPGFDPSSKGWTAVTTLGTLPEYISVFRSPATYAGKNVIAYIAVADMNNSNARFSVLGEKTGYKTPTEFYNTSSAPAIVMNGGYFWDGSALGLIIRNSVTIRDGNPMVWRTVDGVTKTYYPTQAAFGYGTDKVFHANWVYTSSGITYSYPAPAPNKTGSDPLPVPTSSYPSGATQWSPVMAIGAGPLLIKGGVYYNTWEAEMFDASSGVGPTSNNPRSAVGVTSEGFLIFFVCEGRNKTPDTPGLTLQNVADMMLELGCCEAINLDGGGSSCMLVNGTETIKPSDGQQRSVVTAVAIY